MDSGLRSARQVALMLGTSIPRVKRAISDEGIAPVERAGGRVELTPDQVEALRKRLGETPRVPGLTRSEALVSAALARAPFGLTSARAVAARAGVSPTAAGKALGSLREKQLITVEQRTIAAGRAREMSLIRANYSSPHWQPLAGALARVEPAARPQKRAATSVPPRLRHLFWNTAPSQLDPTRAGGYIARRLLSTGDPEGLAWGAAHLSAEDWRHAARTRGISPQRRAFALNIAADRSRIGATE
jgi:hypothetical protein